MKKLLMLIIIAIVPMGMMAQDWLNRSANDYRQRNQQRMIPRNRNQQIYQNRQRYNQQERANQQRREAQLREYTQQQRSNRSEEYSEAATTVRSEANNTTQSNNKVVSLVASGTGQTEKEARENALRSAIEQAFGTFVSANTEVLNDELVKDEIATIASGNINHFNVISTTKNESGLYDVSLQAIVSIGNLTNYTKSKGFQVELAGAEFVMNMKMRELNKKNELAAIEHLQKKLKSIAKNGGLFNYELERSEPFLIGNSQYAVRIKLFIYGNENTKAYYDEIYNTVSALSLSESEVEEYKKVRLDFYVYDKQLIQKRRGEYALRNNFENFYGIRDWNSKEVSWLMPNLIEEALNFVIYDNLGLQIYCSSDNVYKSDNVLVFFKKNNRKDLEKVYYLNPINRIAGVEGRSMRCDDKTIIFPLVDYYETKGRSDKLHFNPFVEYNDYDDDKYDKYYRNIQKEEIMKRKRKNCYFQTEFVIKYSGDDLDRLKNISVKHRNFDNDSSGQLTTVNKSGLQSSTADLTNDNMGLNHLAEENAEFPGGPTAMSQYISKCMKYPVMAEESGIQGNVELQFYVEEDGSIISIKVTKSVDPSLDKEAIRVVRSMPNWKPARKNGKAVKSQQTITIPFRLQ